jgi:hypothetical protein
MGFLHEKQWEDGVTIDWSKGSLKIQTLRKLPTAVPKINAKM